MELPKFNYELIVNKDKELIDIKLNGDSLKGNPGWMNAFKATPEYPCKNWNERKFGPLTVSFYADDIKVVNENTKED